jgi:glycosyltransferase involved in cell wall biosynthesis
MAHGTKESQLSIRGKLAIVMPAYNAGLTIERVFARIPRDVHRRVLHYIVVNDGSTDTTAEALARLRGSYANLIVLDHGINRGYGAAEKTLLRYAAGTEAEIIILLHADGQYAPEELPRLIQPFETEKADIVQGSRMMEGRAALGGGMPLYKYIANRALSAIENVAFSMHMAEYHSGYMLYSRQALRTIPFEKLSENFCFDHEMLIMANIKGLKIVQSAIPTHYGDEVSHLKPIRYGLNVLSLVWAYKRGYYHSLVDGSSASTESNSQFSRSQR